ncbi:MAG: right-handed parallel beta-helix repeat-containing protein, partial [Thermoanaerobaculia bacterium]
ISWTRVACGDTIWGAGGNYSQDLAPAKKCTSGAPLSIRRARSDAPAATASAGWSSTFDATVHQVNGAGILFNGDWDYITISGRTTAAGGAHGWWIDLRGRTQGAGIEFANGAGADYNVMEYMDLQGPGYINYTGDGRGIDATPFSSATGNVFSHMNIFDWESAIYHAGINGSTFEYLDVYDIGAQNWSSWHPNGIYNSGSSNVIVRYSKFHKGPKGYGVGEGIFFEQSGGSSNWQIYANLFYDLNSTGLKAIEITSNVPGLKIYNNTFDNIIVPGVYVNAGSCGTGSETRNNLSFATSAPSSCGAMSNNLTIASSPMPFLNRAGKDYRIVSTIGANYPRNLATNLSSTFTLDLAGHVFGGDGQWDIGAYEYDSGSPPPTLPAPTNLRVAP